MHRHSVPNSLRRNAYNKQNGKCAMCGQKIQYINATVDHVIPISKGGKNSVDNMEVMCYVCNQMKRDQFKDDFLEHIRKIYEYQFGNKQKK